MAIKGDARYTVRKEFTGDCHNHAGLMAGQMWVARFCGQFLGARTTKDEATRIVAAHQSRRLTAV